MLYNRGMENPYCTGKEMTAMFKYANYDYDSLLHNADGIDPESADALYALAQFCRTGKGCQISYEAYRHYCSARRIAAMLRRQRNWRPLPPRAC